jgi:crotonobetainyl-CoA:carnitine CoA-transferase CaiB-like acyl-CoA transferase
MVAKSFVSSSSQALRGVRVLELGQIIAGTYGGQLLSDLGAEVIKIESPEGDLGRNPSVAPYHGHSGLFLTFNRDKKSVVLDLKNEAGRMVFYDLVRVSDVVVDNFRAGVLERLEIDYPRLSAIKPRLVQCSVTGFGSDGTYRDFPAYDLMVQAMSGHVAITGEPGRPPVRLGIPLADLSGGAFACKGMLAALLERERTGRGAHIVVSMTHGAHRLASHRLGGEPIERYLTGGLASYRIYATADGRHLTVAALEPQFFARLCELLDLSNLVQRQYDPDAQEEIGAALAERIASKPLADWLELFDGEDVSVGPVATLEEAAADFS